MLVINEWNLTIEKIITTITNETITTLYQMAKQEPTNAPTQKLLKQSIIDLFNTAINQQ